MRWSWLVFIPVAVAACSAPQREAVEPQQADSALGSFCDRLPRPEYAELTRDAASDDWFEVYEIRPATYAIYEPWQWQEVISWLVVGETRALLFDTGNGISDISRVVQRLTTLPVTVLNSHSHADHVGGNYAFADILSTMEDVAILRSRGLPHEAVADEVSPQALCRGLPDGLMASEHVLRPYPLAERVADGAVIDLGGRRLEVIAAPGHTPDAIALLERDPGYLWTGDSFYVGPIWLYAPETDFDAYRASMARLVALVPELTALFPAHNTPEADPGLLIEALAGFDAMRAGEIESQPEWPGTVTYPVGSFSFLVRDDAFDSR